MKNKSQKIQNEEIFNFYAEYEKLIQSEKFISFDKFYATILLRVNENFESKLFEKFKNDFQLALLNKYELVFQKFVISFNISLKFSTEALIPIITDKESSATWAVNFTVAEDPVYQEFLNLLNEQLFSLIKQGFYVELFPNLVIFLANNTESLKLFFSKKWVTSLPSKAGNNAH
ncbi:DUF2714 domain-containing protein [Mycoplasma phocoeninasale]|uniref:DUF2714 domain-containing protein n=1 Tax=Mycoplasma phocoeninasale TaxID=2726117 RepID=UPI0019670EEC|nr:DUF2714 domain-containing protein [Mycoplasma phocoeninasale]MBN0970627.1 DUF2714 domain-containing protein [Mycoplasma phocoeninasale]